MQRATPPARPQGCGSACANIVVHDCLSAEGQSGSAIWQPNPAPRPPPAAGQPQLQANYSDPDPSAPATIRAILTGVIQFEGEAPQNVAVELNRHVALCES